DSLWLQKAGSSEGEYEDAFWPKKLVDGVSQQRFAVADGATETSFSGIWAKQLVRAYGRGEMDAPDVMLKTLLSLQRQWWKIVGRKKLPWYAEEKLRSGTFAALLGLTILDNTPGEDSGTWIAIACGDCCLAQVRGDDLISTFPLSESSSFSNSPVLLSTSNDALPRALEQTRTKTGTWV